MKHYITILTALTLSACILFSNVSHAASFTPTPSVTPTDTRAVLVNQYTVQYLTDTQMYPIGNYCIAVYEFVLSPKFQFYGDGYKTGSGTYQISFSISDPVGWQFYAIEKSYSGYTDNYITCVPYIMGNNNKNLQISLFANNAPINYGNMALGNITVRISYSYPAPTVGDPDPEPYISVTPSISTISSNFEMFAQPREAGLYAIMENAIVAALSDARVQNQDAAQIIDTLDAINTMLEALKLQDANQYTYLLQALNTNNDWNLLLSQSLEDVYDEILNLYSELQLIYADTTTISSNTATIKSYLNSIKSYTNSLKSYMSTFPTYSAQVLSYLGTLVEMNAEEATEAAAIESEYANAQARQEGLNDVVKNVTKPALGTALNIENMVDSTQRNTLNGLLSIILSNGFITKMLIIVLTFATVGFILYGRKK